MYCNEGLFMYGQTNKYSILIQTQVNKSFLLHSVGNKEAIRTRFIDIVPLFITFLNDLAPTSAYSSNTNVELVFSFRNSNPKQVFFYFPTYVCERQIITACNLEHHWDMRCFGTSCLGQKQSPLVGTKTLWHYLVEYQMSSLWNYISDCMQTERHTDISHVNH